MLATLALTALVAANGLTVGDEVCSNDDFSVDGQALTVTLCAPTIGAREATEGRTTSVPLRETVSSRDGGFTRTVTLDFLAGRRRLSRTIDDIPLDRLGISRTLHLTIGYRPGEVRLEHAMLVPGALRLK